MFSKKPHFELHFKQEQYVLYEEQNGKYYRLQWKEIATCGAIKRIHYNTKTWKHYLIIDIDNDNLYKFKENNLPQPNFILKNKDKIGGHLFYVLDKGIYHKNTFYVNKWQILQDSFTKICGGDTQNKGYVGKFINSNHFEYIELNPYAYDIDFLFSKLNYMPQNNQIYTPKKQNLYKTTPLTIKAPKKVFKTLDLIQVGERNNYLFEKIRKYAYIQVLTNTSIVFKKQVLEYGTSLNNSLLVSLNKSELEATIRSICKYCLKNKESIEKYNHKNRGVMNLDYEQELKEKQRLGAIYTSEVKNKKTLFKLKLSILEMKNRDLKINISTLSKWSKIHRHTIRKYREKLPF